jgi:hypothetical protein
MCLFSHTLELVKYGAKLTELINYTFPIGNDEYGIINPLTPESNPSAQPA